MSEHYDIKTPIKEQLKSTLIFGLQARPPIGMILGFVDYRYHVVPLM